MCMRALLYLLFLPFLIFQSCTFTFGIALGWFFVWGRSLLGISQTVVLWRTGQNTVSFWANKTRLCLKRQINKGKLTEMNGECKRGGSSIRRWIQHGLGVCERGMPWSGEPSFIPVSQQLVEVLVIGVREAKYPCFVQVAALATGPPGKY